MGRILATSFVRTFIWPDRIVAFCAFPITTFVWWFYIHLSASIDIVTWPALSVMPCRVTSSVEMLSGTQCIRQLCCHLYQWSKGHKEHVAACRTSEFMLLGRTLKYLRQGFQSNPLDVLLLWDTHTRLISLLRACLHWAAPLMPQPSMQRYWLSRSDEDTLSRLLRACPFSSGTPLERKA